jgi:hypothetical protein
MPKLHDTVVIERVVDVHDDWCHTFSFKCRSHDVMRPHWRSDEAATDGEIAAVGVAGQGQPGRDPKAGQSPLLINVKMLCGLAPTDTMHELTE